MFEIVLTAAVLGTLLGVVRTRRHRHCGPRGHHHHHGWRHHHGHWEEGQRRGGRRRGGGFERAAGEMFKRRLRLDEDQEGIVDHALRDVAGAVKELRTELGDQRADLAAAFRGEDIDDGEIAAIFSRQDEAIARARRDVVSALKQVHAVLEPTQRARAADLVDPESWL